MKTSQEKKAAGKPSRMKMWMARITLLLIPTVAIGLIYGCMRHGTDWFPDWPRWTGKSQSEGPGERNPDTKKLAEKAGKIAHQREMQHELPETSLWARAGMAWISADQTSNEERITEMTADLSDEIGASDALATIRELRALREEADHLAAARRSSDLMTRQEADVLLAANLSRQAGLEKETHRRLTANGVTLTLDQVRSLGASPNSEDLASMISAFATLKEVNAQMEAALRKSPSQENAQSYYATHLVLLNALDNIQQRAMTRIEEIHLVRAQEIETQAKETADNARELLRSNRNLSENEKLALKWNVESCNKTVELSQRTQRKLRANFAIIAKANEKLAGSIATAENSHMTARLQKEILALENSGGDEIAKIEALTVPQLAAVNFADPENLEVAK